MRLENRDIESLGQMTTGTMDHTPSVSTVVAAYNEEDSIAKTIQSHLGQTLVDHEIVVVDDGSTDQTVSVVEQFDDDRVRLVQIDQNGGLPAALNRGINASHGKYIARLDADESSLPTRLQSQRSVLESNPSTAVVASNYRLVAPTGERIVDVHTELESPPSVDQMIQDPPEIAHGSVMMRREAIESVGGYREQFSLAQDYDLWLRLADQYGSGWLSVIPRVLYKRRIDVGQLEKRSRKRAFAEAAKKSAKRRQVGKSERIEELVASARTKSDLTFSNTKQQALEHYLAGTWLLREDQFCEAIAKLVLAIWSAPTVPRPWYRLVVALTQLLRSNLLTAHKN